MGALRFGCSSLLLLFLFSLLLAEENYIEEDTVGEEENQENNEEPTTTTTVTTTTVATSSTANPCLCSHLSFDSDEMSGEFKSPGYPDTYCHNINCTFEIKPHPYRMIRLSVESMRMEEQNDFLHLYEYTMNNTREFIYFRDLNSLAENREVSVAAAGVGFYLVMTTDHSVGGTFRMSFERVLLEDERTSCPYPLLLADSSPRNLSSSNWPNSGCVFRLSSSSRVIHSKSTCSRGLSTWKVQMRRPGDSRLLHSEQVTTEESFYKETNSVDLRIMPVRNSWRSTYYPMEACFLTYYSIDFDPCKCAPSQTISIGESVNLTSPGYPLMFCQDLSCSTSLSIDGEEIAGFKKGFIVSALHIPRNSVDSLTIRGGEKNTQIWSSRFLEETESVLSIIGDSFSVAYTAVSRFGGEHGYSITVTAVQMPFDCLCPSNEPKDLKAEGSYSFRIPAHCGPMTCRFNIPSTRWGKRTIRLSTSYTFVREEESLTVQSGTGEGARKTRYDSLGNVIVGRKLNMGTDKFIRLTYQRSINNSSSSSIQGGEGSFFNITWKWLGTNDCACDDGFYKASANHWDELYSPRYPEDYCINQRCQFTVEAPAGHHVLFNVSSFETEPHADFVSFFDGNETTGRHLLQLHGHVLLAPPIESIGRNASILFVSDNSVTKKGFVIAFRAIADPEEIDLSHFRSSSTSVFSIIFAILGLLLIATGITYFFIKRKEVSFRNPVYVPTIRYSASGAQEIAIDDYSS